MILKGKYEVFLSTIPKPEVRKPRYILRRQQSMFGGDDELPIMLQRGNSPSSDRFQLI